MEPEQPQMQRPEPTHEQRLTLVYNTNYEVGTAQMACKPTHRTGQLHKQVMTTTWVNRNDVNSPEYDRDKLDGSIATGLLDHAVHTPWARLYLSFSTSVHWLEFALPCSESVLDFWRSVKNA